MLTLPEVWPAAMVMVSPLVKVTKMLFWATPPVKVAVYVIPLVTPSATLAVADRSTTTPGDGMVSVMLVLTVLSVATLKASNLPVVPCSTAVAMALFSVEASM